MGELLERLENPLLRSATAVVLVGALAVACTSSNKPQNLLEGTWGYMPGVSVDGSDLHIKDTGLAILELEENGRPRENTHYIANPPVNLYGSHLKVSDENNVGIAADIDKLDGSATISLLQTPPTRYDEHIERPAGMSVQIEEDTAKVQVWDGKRNQPTQTKSFRLDMSGGKAHISVDQKSDGTTVAVNDSKVTLPERLLKDEVWFGFDASNTWNLTGLESHGAEAVDVSKQHTELAQQGLYSAMKQSGNGNKYIGTAVDMTTLASNPEYEKLVAENFNEIEPEMAGKFQALQPKEGQFEFGELDALVKWAQQNDKQVHGHTLAFTEAYPKWLGDKLNDPKTTANDALALLRTHIKTVVGRYDGKHGHGTIDAWDVVNEPFDPQHWNQLNTQNIWYKKLGKAYIAEALKAAHEANPHAKLYINEWSLETDTDRRSAMISLAKELLAQKVPLDGIGFQAHFDKETLNDDEVMNPIYDGKLSDYLREFTDLGLDVRISEASIAEAGDPVTQSDTYEALAEACMRVKRCVGLNIWGASNSSYKERYPYFTADFADQDPGDDAPTTQSKVGKITLRPAWKGLKDGLTSEN